MKLLIKNGNVIDPATNTDAVLDVLVEDGVIKTVAPSISDDADKVIDATGLVVAPGLIDMHVHFRSRSDTQRRYQDWFKGSGQRWFYYSLLYAKHKSSYRF